MTRITRIPGGTSRDTRNREFAIANGGEVQVDPYFTMKTAQGTIQSGWLASQADMLAEDWQVVE